MFLNVVVKHWGALLRQPSVRSIGIFALSGLLAACNSDDKNDSVASTATSGSSTAQSQTINGNETPVADPQNETPVADPQEVKQISITGGAIKGVIENGVVRIFSIESEAGLYRKSPTPLGYAERTDANGQFNISISAGNIDGVVVEITADAATRMTCDVVNGCGVDQQGNLIGFGQTFALNNDFILEAAYSGLQEENALILYVTPLTHLAVSYAKGQTDGLSERNIGAAYALVEDTLKLSKGSLQLPPPDLTKLDSYNALSGDELQYAIMSASFLAMVNMPDWGSVDEVINSAAVRFTQSGGLPDENGGVVSEVTLDDLFYQASDIASDLQATVNNEQIIVELISVESSTDMYYQEVSSVYVDNSAPAQGAGNTQKNDSAGADMAGDEKQDVIVPPAPSIAVEEPAKLLTIASHPGSVVVDVNERAQLSVVVQGEGDIHYQWRKDGVELVGENASTLSFNSVALNDSGVYDVIVSNEAGQVPSLSATLAVEELTYTAQLSWSIPTARQDGSMLALNDIAGYVVVYGTEPENLSSKLLVDGAQTTNYPFENLDPTKTYYFKIATLDVNDIQGEFSDVVSKSFL
ncbi:Ig and FN3 domain-containing protein [Alkalimarinus alittae]|uniref:Immunoglobulin domain-containing protein n=1 Tax=Alkalimarinus alittae TaxID=2961619 RepID=A0ABY6MZJ4_9ALTE|nr:Ig and FN3 domain-containing protein [Alkalimarinus alittae]UZE95271.1 immunoglobulin domain-containing protein [Alkalimarinus alittae]